MIALALALALLGLMLSAFFSGSETGLYRATRLRLVMDALGGDPVARGLFWLASRPSLFVATMLIGNNLANYLVSLAVVVGTQAMASPASHAAEIVATLVAAPLLFVYGELVPKNLFLAAPNRLLRRMGWPILVFAVAFAPFSALIWAVDKLLKRLVRHSGEQVQATLARRELRRILEEGHEAGILHPTQRALAYGIFAVAGQPVGRLVTPLAQSPRVRAGMTRDEALGLAQRYRLAMVPVEGEVIEKNIADRPLIGYVRVIELALSPSPVLTPVHPLLHLPETASHLAALMCLQDAREDLALILSADDRPLGIVTAEQLRQRLLQPG
jgi:putative hemolysin